MGVSHIAVIAAASLWGLWPFSCSKAPASTPVQQHESRPSVAVTNSDTASPVISPNAKNLGELDLTNLRETHVSLGEGASCIIKPKLIDRNNVQLTIALQARSADGKTTSFIVTQVSTHPGQPFEVAVGDMDITLVPNIVQE